MSDIVLLAAIPILLLALPLSSPQDWIMDPLDGLVRTLVRGAWTLATLLGLGGIVIGGILLADRWIHRTRAREQGKKGDRGIGGLILVIGLALVAAPLSHRMFFGGRDEGPPPIPRRDPYNLPPATTSSNQGLLGFGALIFSVAALLLLRHRRDEAKSY